MESEQNGPDRWDGADGRAGAEQALGALASGRATLADRVATPRWYNPLLAAATALFIAAPAAGDPSSQSMVVVFGCVLLVLVTMAYQKETGVTMTRPAGPMGIGLAVCLGIVILLLLGTSGILAATGHHGWIAATTAAASGAMWIGARQYDRVNDRELRHGR